ncbi:MAG: hypothetical protein IPM01_11270 [Burkholderiaceae bacterium]|nr:hypothetical protein [Burkholderiaceae bacterium]
MSQASSLSILHVTVDRAVVLTAPPDVGSVEGWYWLDCGYDDARSWVEPVRHLTGISVFEDHLLDAENQLHPSYFDSTRDYEMIVFRGLAPHNARRGQPGDAHPHPADGGLPVPRLPGDSPLTRQHLGPGAAQAPARGGGQPPAPAGIA